MILKLRHWVHPVSPSKSRVYVDGLPGAGKAFVHRLQGGRLALVSDTASPAECASLLEGLLAGAGASGLPPADAWNALVRRVESKASPARPAPASPPAGGAPHALQVSTIKVPAPVRIVVDHREPEEIDALLRQAPNVVVERAALALGDYVLADGKVIVERKSVADFEASVIEDDKRLFNQAERLGFEAGVLGVVLIEGDLYGRAARMLPQQISGALSYLAVIKGLSILPSLDLIHTAYQLVKLATHVEHGLGYELALRSAKPKQLISAQRYVLEGLPGVSAGLAERLLAHFGSVRSVVLADEAALQAVPGVGPKTAARIVEVLTGR